VSHAALERLRDWGAQTAVVLGSGLSSVVDNVEVTDRIAFSKFAELPPTGVQGHVGEFICGRMNGIAVLIAKGRVHLYEGHPARGVTASIRLLSEAHVRRVVLTNAAGTANQQFAPGSWMMLSDHLNLTGTSPLTGAPEFVDMTDAYSGRWRLVFAQAAARIGIVLHEGVYAGLSGPQYETPAEVRMLREMGADAIGMSTVLETIQARALGMAVAGFSCLTNWAAGMTEAPLKHEDVLAAGKTAASDFARLLAAGLVG
jgi:purine-nucleoside phosphorylase